MKKFKFNFNTEAVKGYVELVGGVVVYGLLVGALNAVGDRINNYGRGPASYSDAVEAIMNSSMTSYSKECSVRALKPNCDSEIYAAVCKIAKGSSTSFSKEEMIRGLFKD